MDSKYEFNLKMDQLKKLVGEEDYKTAFKIVDSIDWNRVRNVNLLTTAATVYEKNNHIKEAQDILKNALDRAPVGKRILYKLSELSVKTGDLDDAEDYYYEFRRADPTDIGNYLLQYMILKARHAPYDKQMLMLELYCEADPDERWLYELATVYDNAGEGAKCVAVCDKIALLYGNSDYSRKALRLKMKYEPLTGEQQNILYPRSYTGASARKEEKTAETEEGADIYSIYGLADEPDISTVDALKEPPAEEVEKTSGDFEEAVRNSDALAAIRFPDEDAAFEEYLRQMDMTRKDEHRQAVARRLANQVLPEEGMAAAEPQTASAPPAEDVPAPETPEVREPEEDTGAQLSFAFDGVAAVGLKEDADEDISGIEDSTSIEKTEDAADGTGTKTAAEAVETAAASMTAIAAPEAAVSPVPEESLKVPESISQKEKSVGQKRFHMIVEADSADRGFEIAVNELREIHKENSITNPAVKTTAAKLNETGFSRAIVEKIKGRDLVIENAGSLDEDILAGIFEFMKLDRSGTIIVLVDTPEGLDRIEDLEPGLFDIADYISDTDEDEEASPENTSDAYEDEYDEDSDDDEENESQAKYSNLRNVNPKNHLEQMEIDDFAQYCTQYATSIDCSITGKSMLALYERIELMEEEGIPLTKDTAIDLIEEAADRAEKPPLGKMISGAFRSKYDKNGLLILNEDDFI